jgi:hypothetical protein
MYVFTHVPCSSSQREAHAYTQAALAMIYLTEQTQSSGLCYQLQSPARACAPGRTPRIGAATVQGAIDRCHRRGKKGQRERCSSLSPNITTGLLAVRFIILICRRLVQRSAAGRGACAPPTLPQLNRSCRTNAHQYNYSHRCTERQVCFPLWSLKRPFAVRLFASLHADHGALRYTGQFDSFPSGTQRRHEPVPHVQFFWSCVHQRPRDCQPHIRRLAPLFL